jgi:hypothetical protein
VLAHADADDLALVSVNTVSAEGHGENPSFRLPTTS